MATDEFLLVVTPDWVEIEGAQAQIEQNIGLSTLQNTIADHAWADFLQEFTDVWAPPEGSVIVDARILNNGGLRLWVKLAAV